MQGAIVLWPEVSAPQELERRVLVQLARIAYAARLTKGLTGHMNIGGQVV